MTSPHIDPSRESFDAFKALPRDVPIQMLNHIRYNDSANYPGGHEHAGKGWSGERAYAEYGKASGPIFKRVGGVIIWRGKMEMVLTGPDSEQWDASFIAQYPNAAAFFEMIADADYKLAVVNRQAAVFDSRLIRFAPMKISGGGVAS